METISVFHIPNTKKDIAEKYGYKSWVDYWKIKSKHSFPQKCPCCGKSFTMTNYAVGSHVVNYKTDQVYIMPCCNNCNVKNTSENKLPTIYDVEEKLLIEHPST